MVAAAVLGGFQAAVCAVQLAASLHTMPHAHALAGVGYDVALIMISVVVQRTISFHAVCICACLHTEYVGEMVLQLACNAACTCSGRCLAFLGCLEPRS